MDMTCYRLIAVLALAMLASPARAEPGMTSAPRFKNPLGLAVDQDGRRAYVALNTAGTVAVVDLQTGTVLREVPVGKEPRDVILDSGVIHVMRAAADEPVTVGLDKLEVLRRPSGKPLPDAVKAWNARERFRDSLQVEGVSNVRALRWRDSLTFAVHQRPKANVPASQVSQGWVFTNALAVRDLEFSAPAILDEPARGFADPSDVVLTPDHHDVLVACAGADVVLVLDYPRLRKHLAREQGGYWGGSTAAGDDLTASRHYLVARLATQANPRRLALSGNGKILIVSNHLADSLTVIDVPTRKVLRHIPLGGPQPDAARRGAVLFNSARMTFHGQFTCASCHPDGRADGLMWDLERDGVGNFKRTKSLLGVRDTAPYGWHGSSPTLADRVRGTLRTLHRHEPTPGEVDDLVAYLETLPPPEPRVPQESDRPAVARGKALFQGKGQCAACHHRTGLDDGKTHDIGTRGPGDTQDVFDTPALWGLSQSASFLHDGRAKTLEEVFTKYNPGHRHGAAHLLTPTEFADLIAYLKSL
jgi:YVTN family beta-propeller protein